jgi:hypothetical protein
MGLWSKSVVIFNSICEHGKQSVRYLAERTGLSKSSVNRHLQAVERRDRYPESWFWETATPSLEATTKTRPALRSHSSQRPVNRFMRFNILLGLEKSRDKRLQPGCVVLY